MNETQQIVAWIIGSYLFIVAAAILLHLAVLFSFIGLYFQSRRIASALEDNGEYLRRIGYALHNSNVEALR